MQGVKSCLRGSLAVDCVLNNRPSKTARVCSGRRASPAAPEPPRDLGLLGLNNTWRRCRRQRVSLPCPGACRVEKHRWWGGWDPPSPWRPRGWRLPTPPAPRSRGCGPDRARGQADTMVAGGRPPLPTPRVSSAGARAPAHRLTVAKVSCLPNLVLFPSVSMAGLQFKHGREHTRPGPCRAVLPLSPWQLPASSPPETWSAFYKGVEEQSFQPPTSPRHLGEG